MKATLHFAVGAAIILTISSCTYFAKPNTFDRVVLAMADGTYDLTEQLIDGDSGPYNFLNGVMGFSATEVENFREDAIDFFAMRFGLDVNDPAMAGRIEVVDWALNPLVNYRVYAMTDAIVKEGGVPLRDGGFLLRVLDTAGVILGGEPQYAGRYAPPGTLFVYGWYNFRVRNNSGAPELIVMKYQSGSPTIFGPEGALFTCDLFSDSYPGVFGAAQGIFGISPLPDGNVKANIRNTMTISALGDG